jgi:hypothetical protein
MSTRPEQKCVVYSREPMICSIKSGYVQDVPGLDGASIPEGRISMDIEILAVTGIDMECPRNDPEITGEGRLRTRWTIKDFYTLSKKVQENQKISSSDFQSDGDFFLDIYPRGYRTETAPNEDSFLSVYLHSTRQQVCGTHPRRYQSSAIFIKARCPPFAASDPRSRLTLLCCQGSKPASSQPASSQFQNPLYLLPLRL